MTKPIKIPNFLLKEGLEYTQCLDSPRCPGGAEYRTTLEDRSVELIIDLDADNIPLKATAYQPNEAACSRAAAESSACKLHLIFAGNQLDELKNSSTIIQDLIARSTSSSGKPESPREEVRQQQNIDSIGSKVVDPSTSTLHPSIPLILGLVGGLVGGAAFNLIRHLVPSVWNRFTKEPEIHKKRSNTPHSSEIQEDRRNTMPTQAERITQEVARQLSRTEQKVNMLAKDVAELQTDLIALSQKEKMPAIKTSSVIDQIPDVSFATKEPKSYLPVPPPPLSVDLIRQAVAGWNYEAIANYNFEFVTETSQSFEGNTDFKCFTIDGNKTQADGRSQSEFIAINYQNVTYLIPNILKNAAEPARTINRHLDRIYKRGIGSDLTNLERLAIIRRTGDYYELVEMGQVA